MVYTMAKVLPASISFSWRTHLLLTCDDMIEASRTVDARFSDKRLPVSRMVGDTVFNSCLRESVRIL